MLQEYLDLGASSLSSEDLDPWALAFSAGRITSPNHAEAVITAVERLRHELIAYSRSTGAHVRAGRWILGATNSGRGA